LALKKEFIVERNGRSFVLYAGLLDLAHERGLRSVTTTLVQIPSEVNGLTAICHATVETETGTFTGLGDASPENVSRMMTPHLIRMAETRAKARALRDAVNVGVTALEELGDLDEGESVGAQPTGRSSRARGSLRPLEPSDVAEADGGDGPDGPEELAAEAEQEGGPERSRPGPAAPVFGGARPGAAPATPKQLQTIARMSRAAGKTISTEGLSRAQASEIISSLIGEMDQLRAS
jgi:hypothetical protein